jgi:hypothetical protein
LRFAVELRCVGFEARQVGVGILARVHRMLFVQQARYLEERAGVLCDHVRCVSPRPVRIQHRHIAVGECESFGCELVRRAHDVDIDACRIAQCGGIDRLHALQPLGDPLRDGLLPLADRSESIAFRAARAPLSIPRPVAVSG